MIDLAADPASFKDPDARIFHQGEKVYRVFTSAGEIRYRSFLESGLSDNLTSKGYLIQALPLDEPAWEKLGQDQTTLVVEHPRIPFLSYAYEWSFEMLRSAGLLQLDLMLEGLEKNFILKDATPYNVQFIGPNPVQIDVTSFEPWREGTAWVAYSQFCRMFLNPLLLTSQLGVPFQPWMRGSMDGIAPEDLSRLLPWYRKVSRGAFLDVTVQAWLNRRFGKSSESESKTARETRISKEQIAAGVRRLRRTLQNLRGPKMPSAWIEYEGEKTYTAEGEQFKDEFVDRWIAKISPGTVWDMGCNTGRYSEIASRHSDYVIAMDNDPAVIDDLYLRLRRDTNRKIHPLVMDILNPSPSQGWNERERPGLTKRKNPDFILGLALVHHLAISGNLPLSRFVDWLGETTRNAIVEFVPKTDPMVIQLLRWREDVFDAYTREEFEGELRKRFQILETAGVPGSDRTVYMVTRPAGG